eukprot:jgi/Botrbrau1/16439/Bobra.0142s0035.1
MRSLGRFMTYVVLIIAIFKCGVIGTVVPLPVVLWHGMGDSCCGNHSIGAVAERIRHALPGTFVYSIATGASEFEDIYSTYIGNVNIQVTKVCNLLQNISELRNGFNAVGFSQGGQFLRAVVQRCQHSGLKVHTLVTLGGQHQGIMNVPECWEPSVNATPTSVCKAMQEALAYGAYLPWIRDNIIQAQYFKDPYNLPSYLAYNPFLPDINNELPAKNTTYKDNLASLERLVLFKFSKDLIVVPRESSWFGFYNGQQLVDLKDSDLYKEDWIGLRELDESGRLDLVECPGQHMHFSLDWFESDVIHPYLGTTRAPSSARLSVANLRRQQYS